RERVIRIFPNRASALRLIGALIIELDETWRTERRLYLNMTTYWQWRKNAGKRERTEGGAHLRKIS
ncbi:MAG TPA: transposase, partial [Bacillota bacterium]